MAASREAQNRIQQKKEGEKRRKEKKELCRKNTDGAATRRLQVDGHDYLASRFVRSQVNLRLRLSSPLVYWGFGDAKHVYLAW